MLWSEELWGSFTAIFLLLVLLTRDKFVSCGVTFVIYLLLLYFRFSPLPAWQAQLVLKPRGQVSVIAHRGGAHDAPENTLAAIRQAAQNGATGVELDLEFTSDGVPVLMHDDTVDRTTDGTGSLCKFSYIELRKLNPAAKHRLGHLYSGEKIPTLEEAVKESMHYNLTIFFDVKGHASEAAAALKQLYKEFPQLYNASIVCSFDPQVIYSMRLADTNVVTALTHRPWLSSHYGDGKPRFTSTWMLYLFMIYDIISDCALNNILWNLCGISAFLMQKSYISERTDAYQLQQASLAKFNGTVAAGHVDRMKNTHRLYVKQWRSRGVEVVGWTVNDFSEKSYYENILGCSYITDCLTENCSPHF